MIDTGLVGNGGGVETEMIERQREPEYLNCLVEVAEQQENFARSIQMLVTHDGCVVESALEPVFDAGGKPPGELPQQAAFARKTSPEAPALAQQKSSASQDKWKIGQMLKNGNGIDTVIFLLAGDFLDVRIDMADPRAIGAILPKLFKWFDGVQNAVTRKIRKVIEIPGANVQESSTSDVLRDPAVHPGFKL
jgi:hypothetical protein